VIDEAMVVHTEVEHRLVSALPARDRGRLVDLLRTLLRDVDRPESAGVG
jgi:hypothetical protein